MLKIKEAQANPIHSQNSQGQYRCPSRPCHAETQGHRYQQFGFYNCDLASLLDPIGVNYAVEDHTNYGIK
jgi:hypothetical protein